MKPAGDALESALALLRSPGLRATLQARPLPDGLTDLLALAAGSDDSLRAAAARTRRSGGELRDAARFYVEQILFAEGSDAYRILGVSPDAPPALIRRHYRLLASWLHPDRAEHADAVFSSTLNAAFTRLRSERARADYDAGRARRHTGAAPTAAAAVSRRDAAASAWRHAGGDHALQAARHAAGDAARRPRFLKRPVPILAAASQPKPQATRTLGRNGARLLAGIVAGVCLVLIWIDAGRTIPSEPDPAAQPAPRRSARVAADTVPVAAAPVVAAEPPQRLPSPSTAPSTAPTPTPASTPALAPMPAPMPVADDAAVAGPDPSATRPVAAAPARATVAGPLPARPAPPGRPIQRPVEASPAAISPPDSVAAVAPAETPPSHQADAPDVDQADRRVQRAIGYLVASDSRMPPIWNAPDVVDEAIRIRTSLHDRLAGAPARVELDAPQWSVAVDRLALSSGYRIGPLETGRLRVELVWRERQWLISTLQLEPQ